MVDLMDWSGSYDQESIATGTASKQTNMRVAQVGRFFLRGSFAETFLELSVEIERGSHRHGRIFIAT
jgi:hypothetical protein